MIIFTDENIPPHLAKGFNILQAPESLKSGVPIEVIHWPEFSAYSEKDHEWMPKIAALNACMITQDIHIAKRRHEIELFRKSNLGIFFLKGKNKKLQLTIWEMVEILAKAWPEISKIAVNEKKPFGYDILYNGKIRKVAL
ncbi:hypothetical protein P872_22280 [Rhodonellum psychrophilum GCM71 = DSM 17998]|uniref:VapC45 PIN like domain-containing protein n=2 Tax=Rhodonellum TaxID=336827 RepID=U5BID5_9BACT|nr:MULTISPECIES: hypothetical protein [Rhodonellum]ERM80175.1 hypothetical protein P872_22280 [Rhodonellum psychrophilum GCM71 = DSM 17998]SDZ59431.1 hypothetical protein SAMN05444412_1433 [Rhodonellum ikkaensis]